MATALRRGYAQNFTLDFDAVEILRKIAPSKKSYGRVLSELLRREAFRQEVLQEERTRLANLILGEGEVRLDR